VQRKPSKVFYVDVETTGIDHREYEIIQLAGIIEIDGEVEKEFSFDIKAQHPDHYDQKALDIHEISLESLQLGFEPSEVHASLTSLLGKYVDKFDKSDKFTPAGYNVRFDVDHLSEFFRRNNDKYYGSWFNWRLLDALSIIYLFVYMGRLSLPNYQLGTVCDYFKIPLVNKHSALDDIRATRMLMHRLVEELNGKVS